MNTHLENIKLLLQDATLPEDKKQILLKAITEAEKQWTITDFKLDRTEKVKRTTAILLEETIEELEQKRKAVEAQNRELEIESSLERVRAVAMGMKKSDDLLSICEVLFKELRTLGFSDLRNTLINTFVDEQNYFIDYDFSDFAGGSSTRIPYSGHPVIEKYIKEATKKNDAFIEMVVTGKELEDWKDFRRANGETDDPRLDNISALYYYNYSIGVAGIGISTFQSITREKLEVLKRFRNVFDLAYKRYIDITQAEAQARESQIQLAMERVRARTMAMQKSEELGEISFELVKQVQSLGVATWHCAFNIYDEDQSSSTEWGSNAGGTYPTYKTPREGIFLKYYEIGQTGETLHVEVIGEDKCADHYTYLCTLPGVGEQLVKLRDSGVSFPTSQIDHVAYFKYGYLLFITYEPVPDAHDVFRRFAKVFEQTYTRFLDLQKAEAQVREAKIEASLERTRTQSMLMQHSKELDVTLRVFHEQVLQLGIHSAFSFLWLPDEDKDRHIFWAVWGEAKNGSTVFKSKAINYPLDRNEPATAQCLVDWKSNEPVVSYQVPPAGVKSYFAAWQELIAGVEQLKPEYFSDGLYYVEAFMNYGCFGVIVATDLPEEEKKVLGRFAIEFERTYTRFLDLQKSEAQARESQIQLALERVRARTMAMQQSEELQDAAILLFEQMKALGVHTGSCGFNIWDKKEMAATVWMSSAEGGLQTPFKMPHTESAIYKQVFEAMKKGEDFLVKEVGGKTLEKHFDYLLTLPGIGDVIKQLRETGYVFPETMVYHFAFFNNGYLSFHLHKHHPETHDIFKRFAKVFEQTYTRFLDLQRAEAQAREAQIEVSLERVRSKTMAMHNSNDVGETVIAMFAEFTHLGIHTNRCGIIIFIDEYSSEVWTARSNPEGKASLIIGKLILDSHNLLSSIYKAWKAKDSFYKYDLIGDDLVRYYEAINRSEFYRTRFDMNALPSREYHSDFFFAEGAVFAFTGELIAEEHTKIIKRFAGVFGQTYRRYLDLQKAEAQAREAQIETALERVRSRTMAMQRSEELPNTALLMFQQLQALGVQQFACSFNIWDDDRKASTCWGAREDALAPPFKTPSSEDIFVHILEAAHRGESLFIAEQGGEELETHYRYMSSIPEVKPIGEELSKAGLSFPSFQIIHCAFFSQGYLMFITYEPVPEAHDIFKRFAKVFEQTYTRFLDLQKAEAQAKESQIETALERVRSRSMGMQKSEELKEVIQVVYEQFGHLNILVEHAGFIMDYKERDDMHIWLADQHNVPSQITIPYFDSPHWNSFIESKEKELDFFANHLSFEEKNNFYNSLFKLFPVPEEAKEYYLNCPGLAISTVLLDNVGLYIENFSGIPYSDEENATLMRFGKVFQQTHTRFLDLQKAETQAREAKIEAGLERVRYSAMAMQSSEDVGAATAVVFHEIALLGVETMRCCITVLHPDMTADVWAATATNEGKDMKGRGRINFSDHPLWVGLFDAWKNKAESFSFELKGDDLKTYYKALANSPNYDSSYIQNQDFPDHFLYATFFEQGAVFTFSLRQHDDYKRNILKRFTAVFSLTFRRYLDLQKAEAQALEAIKRASVDRIRAEIASMRTTDDLEKITPLVWNELTTLSVPFIRCGVFIMDEEQQLIHTFLSTPEGKAIATLHVPFEFNLSIITNGVDHWRKKERYQEYWDATAFAKSWIALSSLRETSGDSHQHEQPPENLHLHLLPFVQGMLYVGNDTPLNEVELQLVQNLAGAFSTAYARYEDFNKLESANIKIERTLVDLKQAQAQLVQSEKMASLGELTAGIAHEIQNPLNFVNNFSDVNKELLEELKEEMEKGNYEEVKMIANDIAGNEEKISHHGKRADAIVKGMLQHSRSTSTLKEPTDINALADEYLRLAYHGLRAKDKNFNATMKTDYDVTIGKVNIIPQDIGRVILNIITNAFYTVNEKKKSTADEYEPMVSISTKKIGVTVEIALKDNGNGIAKKIVDKIFQPFFTTKPTGQGTGLGLSLAYDIVKAHGGEIKVETKEKEETVFTLTLPI